MYRFVLRRVPLQTDLVHHVMIYWLWKGSTEEARRTLEALPESEPSLLIQWAWFWQRVYEGSYQEAIDGLDLVPDEPIFGIDLFLTPKPLLAAQAYSLMGEPERARAAFEEARLVLETAQEGLPNDPKVRQALAIKRDRIVDRASMKRLKVLLGHRLGGMGLRVGI